MNGRTGQTRTLWLRMMAEGGRWAATELADACGESSARKVAQSLNRMGAAGALKRFEKQVKGDRLKFGVTKDCTVPYGITLADLMAVGVVKETP